MQRSRTTHSIVAFALLGSCSVFIPSHSNSYQQEGESVEIEMIRVPAPANERVFHPGKDAKALAMPALAAAGAAALAGLAIDQIQKAIEEEAEKLEAQHGQRVAVDNFWRVAPQQILMQEVWMSVDDTTKDIWMQEYAVEAGNVAPKMAMRLPTLAAASTEEPKVRAALPMHAPEDGEAAKKETETFDALKTAGRVKLYGTYTPPPDYNYSGFKYHRYTKAYPKTGKTPAFTLECEFVKSTDRSVFLVVPKHMTLMAAKAKVLKLSYWPWHAWSWFADVGNEVEVDVHIAMDAIWIDEKQKPQMQTIGAFDLTKVRFDLTTSKAEWIGSDKQAQGWFPSVPRSHIQGGSGALGTGTFWLEVQVTERDPSSGKNRLEKAAKMVGDKRDDLVEAVRDLGKKGA